VAGQLKRMVTIVSDHIHSRKQFGKPLADFQLIQSKIFNMSLDTYAMESMAYLTAGHLDKLDENGNPPDCSIEAAMVKIYSSESAWQHVSECLQILGGLGYMKEYPYERMLRDCRILLIFEGTNEILRMFVALSSLQYAGAHLQGRLRLLKRGSIRERCSSLMDFVRDEIGRPRLGFLSVQNPAFLFEGYEGSANSAKNWLNPQLAREATNLENITHMYRTRVYQVLKKYGKKVQEEQLELQVLADVAIKIYAMTASLSRCNKSLVLSLRNCDYERFMCKSFISKTYRECYTLLDRLTPQYREDNSKVQKRLSKYLVQEQKYPFAHPLDLNEERTS